MWELQVKKKMSCIKQYKKKIQLYHVSAKYWYFMVLFKLQVLNGNIQYIICREHPNKKQKYSQQNILHTLLTLSICLHLYSSAFIINTVLYLNWFFFFLISNCNVCQENTTCAYRKSMSSARLSLMDLLIPGWLIETILSGQRMRCLLTCSQSEIKLSKLSVIQ